MGAAGIQDLAEPLCPAGDDPDSRTLLCQAQGSSGAYA
jgi:hypothetical protein